MFFCVVVNAFVAFAVGDGIIGGLHHVVEKVFFRFHILEFVSEARRSFTLIA